MTPEQLGEAIARGNEQPSIEFKSAGPRTNTQLFARVVRAMLAMANRRDGGIIILGVEEAASGLVPVGIGDSDLATWRYDHVADAVSPYVDPNVEFEVSTVALETKNFLLIRVKEFTDVPVLCKKHISVSGKVILRESACYIRPRRKPESVEVGNSSDMRDLLDLAAEKSVRRFLRTAHAAGVELGGAAPSDSELFRKQLGELE